MPMGIACLWAMLLVVGVDLVAAATHGTASGIFLGLLGVSLLVLIVGSALFASAYVLGRPQSLIPPALRDDASIAQDTDASEASRRRLS